MRMPGEEMRPFEYVCAFSFVRPFVRDLLSAPAYNVAAFSAPSLVIVPNASPLTQ